MAHLVPLTTGLCSCARRTSSEAAVIDLDGLDGDTRRKPRRGEVEVGKGGDAHVLVDGETEVAARPLREESLPSEKRAQRHTRRHELGNAAVDGERDGGSDRQATQLLGGLLRGAKHEGGAGKWRFDDGHIVLAALKSAEEVHEGLDLWQMGGAGCAGGVGCAGVADCGRCDARRVGRDG